MKSIKLLLVLTAAMLLLSACAAGPFSDDFSIDKGVWGLYEDDPDVGIYFEEGKLRMDVYTPEYMAWSSIGNSYSDVSLSVEALAFGSVEINEYGLICRYNGDFDFYAGLVGSDGYYAIYKGDYDSGLIDVSEESYGFSENIRGLDSSNNLRLDCIGDTITLSVNGLELVSVKDSSFTEGDVGLLTSSIEDPNVYVVFDNFSAEPAGE